jgi:pimeloyl-ACP methyl ester carboxylesterase
MRRRAFARMVMPPAHIATRGMTQVIDELETTFGRSLASPPKVVRAQLGALSNHDSTARLAELSKLPTLVMSATHDPIALPVYGRRLAGGIGNARFVEVADASHALPVQLPDLVHAELQAHFAAHTT